MTKPVEEMTWADHQAWEQSWWDTCANTFGEEAKQITYAHRMGLVVEKHPYLYETWPYYNLQGKNVIDLGGGPVSMLLKTWNRGDRCTVVDPCVYPRWTLERYAASKISVILQPAEIPVPGPFDEAWIYNVLQHTVSPDAILKNAMQCAKLVRIFEWIERPLSPGHPQTLKAQHLNAALKGIGRTEDMKGENGCWGLAYFGTFHGEAT